LNLAHAYGLTLRSTRPIPGLLPQAPEPDPAPADLTVHWGVSHPAASGSEPGREGPPLAWHPLHASDVQDDQGRPLFVLDRADDPAPLFRLAYADGTTFWVRPGATFAGPTPAAGPVPPSAPAPAEIWAHWPDDLTSEDASTYFLGPVLGHLLRMRGQTVLHASAVGLAPVGELQPGAVALVGPPGAGKSTTAAAFFRRGHPVLTEDACALEEPAAEGSDGIAPPNGTAGTAGTAASDAPFRVLPGYPLVRLWSDSVEMLFGRPDALPLLTPTWDKRYLPLEGTGVFATEPQPLRAIFLLEEREDADDAPRVLSLSPAEAFLRLVANTYRNLVLSPGERVMEFRTLHRLLRTTPVYRIIPHTDPARLDDLLDLILATAAAGD